MRKRSKKPHLLVCHKTLTDTTLASLFKPFGRMHSAKVFLDKTTGQSCGLVKYASMVHAKKALRDMHGFKLPDGGEQLTVKFKESKESNKKVAVSEKKPRFASGRFAALYVSMASLITKSEFLGFNDESIPVSAKYNSLLEKFFECGKAPPSAKEHLAYDFLDKVLYL